MTLAESKKRKVLLITYSFPPTNSIGAVRSGKFAKYLPEFGWEPIVLTADIAKAAPKTLPVEMDEANIMRTPYFTLAPFIRQRLIDNDNVPSHEISRAAGWKHKAYGLIRLMKTIYSRPEVSFFIDEPWGWCHHAVKKGLEIISEEKIDIIFSSYSPSISHFVASRLHKQTGLPWVAEFRDLWSLSPYGKKIQPFQFLEKCWEKRVMKDASQLVAVSNPMARELRRLHSVQVVTIPNGFDEEDYLDNVPLTAKFTITYTGNIYPGKRDPTPLFKAIAELRQEGKISPRDLEVRFFGSNVVETISPLIRKWHLQEFVKTHDSIPFGESIKKQEESTALLLLSWNNPKDKGSLTGKVFEYLGARRPILALAFKSGAIDSLLRESDCGTVANEVDEIKAMLMKWMTEFREYGEISSHYSPNKEVVKNYTRRGQTRKLAEVFDNSVSQHQAGKAEP